MLERIQKLISQIYEEQKKLKNSELKALQAQIQPHFLYNSLDSVMWLLRMDTVSYTHLDVYKRQWEDWTLTLAPGARVLSTMS